MAITYTGIDRKNIEEQARAIVMRRTGLPKKRVIIGRDAANVPAPIRPFVSIFCRTPSGEVRSGERSYAPIYEYWRAVVNSTTDGDYGLTVSGVPHVITASGLTAPQIRDALSAEVGSSLTSTVTSPGSISIDIESTELQDRLLVVPSSPSVGGLTVTKLRTNAATITRTETEAILEVFCWGKFSRMDPGPEDFGEDIAEKLGAAILDPHENASMRACGVVPRTATFSEQDGVLDGEVQTIGVAAVVLGNIFTHVGQVADTTAAQFECS